MVQAAVPPAQFPAPPQETGSSRKVPLFGQETGSEGVVIALVIRLVLGRGERSGLREGRLCFRMGLGAPEGDTQVGHGDGLERSNPSAFSQGHLCVGKQPRPRAGRGPVSLAASPQHDCLNENQQQPLGFGHGPDEGTGAGKRQ